MGLDLCQDDGEAAAALSVLDDVVSFVERPAAAGATAWQARRVARWVAAVGQKVLDGQAWPSCCQALIMCVCCRATVSFQPSSALIGLWHLLPLAHTIAGRAARSQQPLRSGAACTPWLLLWRRTSRRSSGR